MRCIAQGTLLNALWWPAQEESPKRMERMYVCDQLTYCAAETAEHWKATIFCSVVSDSLRPHGLQHVRLPCPPLSPRVGSDSCPSSQWCHPTISSSVAPFSSCPQSFWTSGSFSTSQTFASGGQSIGASVSASVFLMNIQDWFPLGRTVLTSTLSKGRSTTQMESISLSVLNLLYGPIFTSVHDHWKNYSNYTPIKINLKKLKLHMSTERLAAFSRSVHL